MTRTLNISRKTVSRSTPRAARWRTRGAYEGVMILRWLFDEVAATLTGSLTWRLAWRLPEAYIVRKLGSFHAGSGAHSPACLRNLGEGWKARGPSDEHWERASREIDAERGGCPPEPHASKAPSKVTALKRRRR
jgi:hypothetical protein